MSSLANSLEVHTSNMDADLLKSKPEGKCSRLMSWGILIMLAVNATLMIILIFIMSTAGGAMSNAVQMVSHIDLNAANQMMRTVGGIGESMNMLASPFEIFNDVATLDVAQYSADIQRFSVPFLASLKSATFCNPSIEECGGISATAWAEIATVVSLINSVTAGANPTIAGNWKIIPNQYPNSKRPILKLITMLTNATHLQKMGTTCSVRLPTHSELMYPFSSFILSCK